MNLKKTTTTLCVLGTSLFSACSSNQGSTSTSIKQKDVAIGIIETGLIDGNIEYLNTHVAEDYIQHNPQAEDGRAGLIGFTNFLKSSGQKNKATIIRAIEQDDLVALHVVYEFGDVKYAAFDLFRFENGIAVEHWDALQPWVEDTASGRSMTDGTIVITDRENTNKNTAFVKSFVDNVLVQGKGNLIPDYIGTTYLQHNPFIADGIAGLGAFITSLQKDGVSFSYSKIHNVVGEGNFVFVQNEGEFGGKPTAFYDLFRVENGKIIEHWDVVQEIPKNMPHKNGMF